MICNQSITAYYGKFPFNVKHKHKVPKLIM